jgi:hypothetical protein
LFVICERTSLRLEELAFDRFFAVRAAVTELVSRTTRASSVIENFNSRLRGYFFHRRFLRSARPERVGKSPAELLTGKAHPHWLEMLGYTRFSRN